MSNEVWVRWKDSTSSAGMVLVDTVNDLGDHAQIKDLRKAFVKQQVVNVSPAAVVVRETESGEMLKANTMLTNYFMPPADSAAAPGPGNSEDTALFLTVPQQQPPQQQQWGVPLAFQPVIEFAKQQMDKHTEGRAFSKAGYTWARLLLSERGIQVRTKELNLDGGQGSEPEGFHWTVETKDNEVVRPGENYKTKGAMDWVLQNFLRSDDMFGLKVVTGSALPELRGHTKKANGKSDLVIGKKAELQIATATDPYDFAFGLIELKQDIYYINKGQNVLELASLATISRVGKNSSLLATDCNTQWELYWFEDERTIVRGVYRSGRKCFEDFRRLLMDAESRVLRPPSRQTRLVLPNFEEHGEEVDPDDEQNLDGFGADDPKTKALERQGQLDALADYLGDLYGVRPNVPSWAMAKNTCPDYYA